MTKQTAPFSQYHFRLKNIGKSGLWLLKWAVFLSFLLILLMLAIDLGTSYLVRERVYTRLTDLPYRENAIVLGTAKFYPSGSPNLYYKHRLDAARYLLERRKTANLWLSGDNKTPYYNEPKMMRRDLLKMGVPEAHLHQDYAGYNTLDSVVRASKVYQLEPFIIISQQFHCERALLIAKVKGIDAICYAAEYPQAHYKVRIREFFARSLMLVSLIFGIDPNSLDDIPASEPQTSH